METRDKKIKEINKKLESYNKKIKFSIVSLYYMINLRNKKRDLSPFVFVILFT
jgi:hypothetical protein